MYLKSLELQGFKSFPDYTKIDFHPGVTAIVGPNGSGKSNVTDAVRWVLGEQSVKTLRGGSMIDVIFSGTEQRRAMSFAEVSITLMNEDQVLPLEYDEVQITRRLFRSGESEYLINRQSCRLKDVVNLFMDTGLGKDGYSIIGQGQIDSILSSKSEDRRKVFEEAAGIQKYKSRRDESQRKLSYTEQNLTRVTDLMNELSAQIGPLGKQAETAKRYLALSEDLKLVEVATILQRIDRHNNQLNEWTEGERATRSDLRRFLEEQGDLELKHTELQEQIRQLEISLTEQRESQARYNESIAKLRSQLAICEEREQQLTEGLHRDRALGEVTADAVSRLRGEIEEQLAVVSRLESKQSEEQAELDTQKARLDQLSAAISTADQTIERLNEERRELSEEKNRHNQEHVRSTTQAEMSRSQLERLSDQHKEMQDELDQTKSRIEAAERRVSDATADCARYEADVDRQQEQVERLTQELANGGEKLDRARQTFNNSSYQLRTLQDLEANMIGYSDTVRSLLKIVRDSDLRDEIMGTVGSLLDVPEEYELAIETALGGAVQNIVVETDQSASHLIRLLKDKRLGRATFLPISTIRGNRLDDSSVQELRRHQGYVGLACDLVSFDDKLKNINQQLLGRVAVVDHLDHARAIAKQTRYRYRIVTLEGDVLNIGGSMTGGYNRKRGSGLLRRARTITSLKDELPRINQSIEDLEHKTQELSSRLDNEKTKLATNLDRLNEAKQIKVSELAQLTQLKESHRGQEEQIAQQLANRQSLEDSVTSLIGRATEHEREITAIETRFAELDQAIAELKLSGETERATRERHAERFAELNILLSAGKEKLLAARRTAERTKQDLAEQQRAGDDYKRAVDEKEALLSENQLTLTRAKADLDKSGQRLVQIQDLIAETELKKKKIDQAEDQNLRRDRQVRDQLARIETELVRVEARIQRVQSILAQEKNRLWEAYELTYAGASKWRNDDLKLDEAETRIQKLKRSIKALGQVNVHAVEEYAQLVERYEFMTNQQNDILKSKKDLNEVIRELTHSMREQFQTNLDKINQNFQQTFAELFGGGRGRIMLENSDDVLTAEIEINVCPPGKKLQNMMLLSGGERSLTAIALLFAILKLRPTPFCIMDEVEASLDESNVFRFTDYIDKYADQSQFIVVTHRKGTMESAARIYGVTMPEHGVSKILSMKLSD